MLIASLLFLQVVIFVGLLLILRGVLNRNVSAATQHLEELDHEYTKKELELNKKVEEFKQKAQGILDQSRDQAERVKAQIVKQAETEKDRMLKDAHLQSDEIVKQADRSREHLIAELDKRIEKEAARKACELIAQALPETFRKDAHAYWVTELIENGFTKLERLHVPEGVQSVRITSAFPLSPDETKRLSKKLRDLLGHEASIEETIDEKVVVGVIVAIGSLVLDGSLRSRILENAKELETGVS
jgi:F0F1-type ATP synthase membrane subunit b/b'